MKKERIIQLFFLILLTILVSCNNTPGSFTDKDIKEGYELSKKYCGTCHMYPEPGLLDQKTWEQHVLPKMSTYLGFEFFANAYIASDSGIGLTLRQWNNIYRYYALKAPEHLPERKKDVGIIAKESPLFEEIPVRKNILEPATTLVLADSVNNNILFGDGMRGELYILSKNLELLDSIQAGIGVSNVRLKNNSYWILSMGIMHPSDKRSGSLVVSNAVDSIPIRLFDSLQRPVHAEYADLNSDGKEDIILSEFGDKFGALSWMENIDGKNYEKHILRPLAGAIKSIVYDFNKDQKPDIMALMAQAEEGVFIYYNQGNGSFEEQRVLRFSPCYGSNYIGLADFNSDGFIDVITSNGDNGDYPPILKSYHGIRIFLNNGKNEFEEKLFLPVNGIGKVIARDFDMDGDLDLASIAYFADFRNIPEEAFIYWENRGELTFSPSTIKNVSEGRWITMDAGDYDSDGDLDIILGNADFRIGDIPEDLKKKWDSYSPSLLILKNRLR